MSGESAWRRNEMKMAKNINSSIVEAKKRQSSLSEMKMKKHLGRRKLYLKNLQAALCEQPGVKKSCRKATGERKPWNKRAWWAASENQRMKRRNEENDIWWSIYENICNLEIWSINVWCEKLWRLKCRRKLKKEKKGKWYCVERRRKRRNAKAKKRRLEEKRREEERRKPM